MARVPRPARARRGRAAVATVTLAGLAGCFTGERPTLTSQPQSTGDPAADAVLQRLQDSSGATFTADYRITPPLGEGATATVAQEGSARRSVTIGTTRYLSTAGSTTTCNLDSGACDSGLDAAPVSNLGVTPNFDGVSPAARLRREASQRIGPTEPTAETIGGQPATCVTIPIATSAVHYCALDTGPLARMRTTDVTIELTAFSTDVADAQFQP